ncbi:hypothetical protein Cgig2_028353 [Carnegiea gigantea]|uniref:R13L1/DRL21-like LRR repeat region domain-containing protein n=1 Tax=Carnegiea gigantea TaxID=171969 RepID=A0A9Q1K2F6_9CARY|nr:hypothetical protein Cgig2_028353 [Carnegiea gigantea]
MKGYEQTGEFKAASVTGMSRVDTDVSIFEGIKATRPRVGKSPKLNKQADPPKVFQSVIQWFPSSPQLNHATYRLVLHRPHQGCLELTHIPLGLGSLTHLETVVHSGGEWGVDELNHLSNVTELEIAVEGLGLAKKANLQAKEKLTSLCIMFNPKHMSKEKSKMVLCGLQPNVNLRYLWIEHYEGEKLSSWMMT